MGHTLPYAVALDDVPRLHVIREYHHFVADCTARLLQLSN